MDKLVEGRRRIDVAVSAQVWTKLVFELSILLPLSMRQHIERLPSRHIIICARSAEARGYGGLATFNDFPV
jgi:hypothetical protein